jgi:hypothetical protein
VKPPSVLFEGDNSYSKSHQLLLGHTCSLVDHQHTELGQNLAIFEEEAVKLIKEQKTWAFPSNTSIPTDTGTQLLQQP